MNAIIKQTLRTAIAAAFIAVGMVAASSSAFAQKNAATPATALANVVPGISLADARDVSVDRDARTADSDMATIDATSGAMTSIGSLDATVQSEQATASTAGSLANDRVQDEDLLSGDSGLSRDK